MLDMVHENGTIHLFCFTQPVGVGKNFFFFFWGGGGNQCEAVRVSATPKGMV